MSPGFVVHAAVPGKEPAAIPPATGTGDRRLNGCVDHDARVAPVSARQGDPGVTPP